MGADPGLYGDEELARNHIEAIRWPDGPACPYCRANGHDSGEKLGEEGAGDDWLRARRVGGQSMGPGWYRCNRCRRKYTVRVGSIFERSHIPLRKWIHAAAIMTGTRRRVSVRQLRRLLGVSYRSAFFMARRIRNAMESDTE